MSNYRYHLVNRHIILQVCGSALLLDTGSPRSVGENTLCLENKHYPVARQYQGVTASYLSEHIGEQVDGLIGMDIIKDFSLTIDPLQQLITVGEEPSTQACAVPIEELMGVPVVQLNVNGEPCKAFFDTGAPISYILSEFITGVESKGRREDFYPALGSFSTDVFELPVTFGTEQFRLLFGVLPELLATALTMVQIQGILGTGLLDQYVVSMSMKKRCLSLIKIIV